MYHIPGALRTHLISGGGEQIPVVVLLVVAACIYAYYKHTSGRIYLLDFACYKPPRSLQVSRAICIWELQQFGKVPPPFQFPPGHPYAPRQLCATKKASSRDS